MVDYMVEMTGSSNPAKYRERLSIEKLRKEYRIEGQRREILTTKLAEEMKHERHYGNATHMGILAGRRVITGLDFTSLDHVQETATKKRQLERRLGRRCGKCPNCYFCLRDDEAPGQSSKSSYDDGESTGERVAKKVGEKGVTHIVAEAITSSIGLPGLGTFFAGAGN
jgi:hypothetical protein